ncbi:MAG: DNA polymerase III subunit gamma/tau [Ktedonobacterales bacterium]
MASQSLYRKWRSQTFSDLVGQEAVTRTLLNAVRDSRLVHAYLFCGPRGTGKTSAARLLAKAVNCARPVDGEPCNECLSCREITAGNSPDVIEIDAASNTGVDNIRDLRENVNLLGVGGRYKLYIIDEAHMLSTQAFNALLKTLEEPPPHVIFVLATTEAHKVPATVVSRCQPFYFRRFRLQDLQNRLQYVAGQEGLELEPAATELLARAAQGGMRDALSLLDQAMAFCGTQIDLPGTRAMLGLADPGMIVALIESVAAGDAACGLHVINDMVVSGADLRQLNSQLGEEWRALLLARAGADVARLMERNQDEVLQISALAQRFSLAELAACARVFARNEAPARGLPVPQLALELSLLDCIQIRAERTTGTIQQAFTMQAPYGESAPPLPPKPETHAPPVLAPTPPAAWDGAEELDLDATYPAHSTDGHPPEIPINAVPEPVTGSGGDQFRETLVQAQNQWDLVKQVCKQRSRSVAALLHSAHPVLVEPGELTVLVLEAAYQFHLDKLREPESRAAVEWALEQVLNQPVRVKLTLRHDGGGIGGSSNSGGPSGYNGGGRPGTSGGGGLTAGGTQRAGRGGGAPVTMPGTAVNGSARPAPGNNITPIRHNVQPVEPDAVFTSPETPEPGDPRRAQLEVEVRSDPVIQSLLRLQGMELVDMRILDDDGETR